jgi:hypothetical protein
MKTIYVSLATLDDSETQVAIDNLFNAAAHPERVYVGLAVIEKKEKNYKKFVKNNKNKNVSLKYIKLVPEVLGTGNGRYHAQSMYSDQDYFLQVDPHTLFQPNWDQTLIDLYEEAKDSLKLDRFVLTAYLGFYSYSPKRSVDEPRSRYPFYDKRFKFSESYPGWYDRPIPENPHKFIPCVKFNGNFVFSDREFAKNTHVVKDSYFYDEEILQGLNLIGNDVALVFPNVDLPVTHLYYNYINKNGGKRKSAGHYLTDREQEIVVHNAKLRYFNYITDPKNKKIVKKYEKYAKISLKNGAILEEYIPKKYLEDENEQ